MPGRFGEHSQQAGRSVQENWETEVSTLKMGTMSPAGRDTEGEFGTQCPVLFPAKLRGTQLPLSSRKSLTLPLNFCVILGKSLALSGPPFSLCNRCGGQVA